MNKYSHSIKFEKTSSSGESQDEVQMEMVDAEAFDILMGNFKNKEIKEKASVRYSNFSLMSRGHINTHISQTN